MRRVLALVLVCLLLSGCNESFVQMGATEYGVRFRNLPTFLGGGVSSNVIEPGALSFVFPWETLYRFDTSVQKISWGQLTEGNGSKSLNYITTRAVDGNEVALSVTVRYQIRPNQEGLVNMVRDVATDESQIQDFVKRSSSALIRTFMNELHTGEYLNTNARYKAVDKVRDTLRGKLDFFNIEVVSVQLDDFRFERILDDGSIDSSYQEKLNETQRIREEIDREKARIETVIAKKQQEFNDVQAQVNRQVAEAEGYKKQAVSRGDAYLAARKNEAQAVKIQGTNEAAGILQKVQSLAGPGGKAILRLEIAGELAKSSPKFMVLGSSQQGSSGIEVKKTDVNKLVEQVGVFEALKDSDIDKGGKEHRPVKKKQSESVAQAPQ